MKAEDARETHIYIKQKSQRKYITTAKLGDSVLKVLYTTEPMKTCYRASIL
jgi:hypothetical protein